MERTPTLKEVEEVTEGRVMLKIFVDGKEQQISLTAFKMVLQELRVNRPITKHVEPC